MEGGYDQKGILGHDELIRTLKNAVKQNPRTTFIACHLANSCADLNVLEDFSIFIPTFMQTLEPGISEISPTLVVKAFMEKYSDRLV
jgi:hypothetical protein